MKLELDLNVNNYILKLACLYCIGLEKQHVTSSGLHLLTYTFYRILTII